jgi:hypothetical protein
VDVHSTAPPFWPNNFSAQKTAANRQLDSMNAFFCVDAKGSKQSRAVAYSFQSNLPVAGIGPKDNPRSSNLWRPDFLVRRMNYHLCPPTLPMSTPCITQALPPSNPPSCEVESRNLLAIRAATSQSPVSSSLCRVLQSTDLSSKVTLSAKEIHTAFCQRLSCSPMCASY